MQNFGFCPALLTRRTALKTAGQGVTLAALTCAFGCAAPAVMGSVRITGSPCLTILYRNGPDITFDYDYYRDHHLSLIMDLYGKDAIRRIELRRVIPQGDLPPADVTAVNIWIRDAALFVAAGARHGATLQADVANFTNAVPEFQDEVVLGEAGHNVQSPEQGQRCLTVLYPHAEGATFDAGYYRHKHMQLVMDLFGTRAIRRFEVRVPQPGQGNPLYLGSVNIYIENQAAFDTAAMMHANVLAADEPNFTGVRPVSLTTEITGLAG